METQFASRRGSRTAKPSSHAHVTSQVQVEQELLSLLSLLSLIYNHRKVIFENIIDRRIRADSVRDTQFPTVALISRLRQLGRL